MKPLKHLSFFDIKTVKVLYPPLIKYKLKYDEKIYESTSKTSWNYLLPLRYMALRVHQNLPKLSIREFRIIIDELANAAWSRN